MKETNNSDEEQQQEQGNEGIPQERDILAEFKADSEEEKEKNSEDELHEERKSSDPMAAFLTKVEDTQNQESNYIDTALNNKIDNQEENKSVEDSFDENLLLECQKEDEENERIIKEKELQKKIKNIKYYNFKDYCFLFFLFMSSSLNFNFLSLYYIVVGILYLLLSENLNDKSKKFKYLVEIFTIGYASYTLLFKLAIVILADDSYNKDFYINLGVAYLHNQEGVYYLFLTFTSEIAMIMSSGYGIYVSFICRTLKSEDINYKNMKRFTIRNLIIISYVFIVLFSVFNISYLTLFYIVIIQISLLLCSLKVNEEKIKKIYKVFVYVLLICISVQLLMINVFNIPRLQEEFLYKYTVLAVVPEGEKATKVYSLLTQIGINYSYVYFENYSLGEFLKKFTGYFFGVLSMISLAFICGELNKGPETLNARGNRGLNGAAPPSGGGKVK